MNGSHEYGIKADERQELDHLRAGSRAFKVMVAIGMVGYPLLLIITRDDMLAVAIGAIALVGMGVYEHYLTRSGWEAYVDREIATNPSVRRRVIRSIPFRALYAGTLVFINGFYVGGEAAGRAAVKGVMFGLLMGLTFWWLSVHRARKRARSAEIDDGAVAS